MCIRDRAYRSHMLHEHLQQHKLADDKTVNQRVDGLVKEQRRQARLRAEIEMQEEMRGHGILQPDTHISPPPQHAHHRTKRTSVLGSKEDISILG